MEVWGLCADTLACIGFPRFRDGLAQHFPFRGVSLKGFFMDVTSPSGTSCVIFLGRGVFWAFIFFQINLN